MNAMTENERLEWCIDVAKHERMTTLKGKETARDLAEAIRYYDKADEDDPFLRERVLGYLMNRHGWINDYDKEHGIDDGASDASVRCPMYAAMSDALGLVFHHEREEVA